jgi:hypothetical protein
VYDLQSLKVRSISETSRTPILVKKKNDHQNFVGYQLALRSATKEVVEKLVVKVVKPHPNVNHDLHLTLFEFEVDS